MMVIVVARHVVVESYLVEESVEADLAEESMDTEYKVSKAKVVTLDVEKDSIL